VARIGSNVRSRKGRSPTKAIDSHRPEADGCGGLISERAPAISASASRQKVPQGKVLAEDIEPAMLDDIHKNAERPA